MTTTSPPQPVTAPSNQSCHSRQGSAPLGGTKPVSLPPNLDEMKVAELKSELKLRNLPVSGTKNDLIERLRTYQELNGGSDTTSSPLAGGPTGPGTEGAGKPFRTAAATTSKQQHQCQQTSSLTGDACSSAPPPTATPEQLTTCVGTASSPPASLTPSDHSPPAMSPEDNSFNSDLLGEMVSSPPTQLGLQSGSAAQLPLNIKEESPCSTPAPCQFSFTPSSLQKQYPVTSAAHTTRTTTPLVTVDKDKMLQEKDKQIQELTRMLRQKQRLVEVLRMQLEHGKKGGRVPDPVVLVRVKQEPPDKPNSPLPSSVPCGMDVTKVNIKQEAIEAEEAVSETTVQSPDFHGFPQFSNRAHEVQEQILMHSKPEQRKQEQHVCLQQTTLRLAQQQAIHELLLQQQHNIQNHSQTPENQQNLQKRSQQRKKKPQKQQQKQQLVKSQQGHQQMQLKQQILLKQQKSLLQQQIKQHQQQTKQPQQIQIQTKIHLKQQQVLIQQNQKVQQQQQQQPPQVLQAYPNKQPGLAPVFPLDLLKRDSTPALVTDSHGNHFLIALTSHITGNQKNNTAEGKAANHIMLQRLQSAPATLPGRDPVQPPRAYNQSQESICMDFQKEQNTNEVDSSLDVLFSPLSPASVKTTASSPDNKDREHEADFIDIILQTGETSTALKPAAVADPSPDHLYPVSAASSPPPSTLHLLSSPPIPASCHTTQPALLVQTELLTEEKPHLSSTGSGRLEDFLESTTGKPLLGVEPGGLLTLIDDLHSQMLCTPSILDHPPSPMDTLDRAAEPQQGLDSMDWLDLSMGGERGEETPTMGPQSPPGVFSTDFLDSYDLQIPWDSCL
uniref:SAP domain-containing protein n=2 Tax=Monopterus albus TaxID=43700 RepID=A0A3Q3K8N0_MONAL